MSEDILKPSLKDDSYRDTQVYDIDKLFYVAFLGGAFPTIVLGTINARRLKVDKWLINLLIGIGAAIILSIIAVSRLKSENYLFIDSRTIRWSNRIASVLLYLCYRGVLKQKFKQHMLIDGKIKPIFKDAVKWVIIGFVVEFILSFAVLEIIKNVL